MREEKQMFMKCDIKGGFKGTCGSFTRVSKWIMNCLPNLRMIMKCSIQTKGGVRAQAC